MSNKSSKRAEEELQLRNTTNKIISNKSLVKSR